MTDKDLFVEILKSEIPRFERVIKAVESVPKHKHSYKHDAKSRTAFELLSHALGSESGMFSVFLKTGKLDFLAYPKPKWKTAEGVRKDFVKNMKNLEKLVKKMDNKKWSSKAQMFMGSKMEWEEPRGKIAWEFLLDLIHHRGQLSTYLRPMGGKVPSIYGPSADSK
ncbi:MAG: DinB family protein [Parcubacteria group bacterium Gr01-1014_46]|nr:MAG: DinB family protein [Parcubacteria group bacterium Gr01-1014_46]